MSKVIVVIGASRGLGLEFCRQYVAQGDQVFACCRTPEKSAELLALQQSINKKQKSGSLEIIPLDVDSDAMLNNLHQVIDSPIDVLIHNAGVYGPRHTTRFDQVDAAEWMEVLRTNTIAPLRVVQTLVDKVVLSNEKKIILLSSKMGSIEDNKSGGSYIYRSTKAALNAVGKSLSIDLKEQGVKVALVHPGWVQTDMGGPNAMIDTECSILGLCQVIESLSENNSGTFFNYDGAIIPW